MIYDSFAKFYDELFDPAMYDAWLDFVRQQAGSRRQMIDLACGTGRLAIKLKQAGFDVTGLDLAPEMLSLAAERAASVNVNVPLIEGDFTALGDLGQYELITCFDDSLCYLPDEAMLLDAFREAKAHLTSSGRYLFDVITPYQTDTVYPGYMYNFHDDERAFMWSSYEGEQPHSVEHDLNFFIWNEALNGYDHHAELHIERTYSLATYQHLLHSAGFTKVTVTSDFGQQPIDETTTRWFFVCEVN
ncbi:class I SAM-dependent DNA methyltransferase [Furfurilactobacillus curtus]|uniref:Methyltransferase n=1 Tax=Furfurilactobacillus curtus TaxID=1746200 RepID=A0ABQ5JLM8_9LACO